jgi:hypothetical protein
MYDAFALNDNDFPTDDQLVNWREADEYRNEAREDEDNTYDPDGPHEDSEALAPCGCYTDDPGCPHDNEPEFQLCECELDWRCPLHRGQPTPLELQNDAWASVQTAIDAQNGM